MDSDFYGGAGQQDTSLVSAGDRHVRADRPRGRLQAGLQQPRRHRRRRRQRRRRRRPGRRSCTRRPTCAVRARTSSSCRWRPASPTSRSGSTTTRPTSTGGGRSTTCSSATAPATRVRGGLVVGNVRGATGPAGINGATVTSLDKPDGEGGHRRDSGRRGPRRRLLLDVLEPDGTPPVRGHGEPVHVADAARSTWPPTGRRRPTSGSAPAT